MAKTSAERQRAYRERALRDPDGLLLTRVQVLISAQANGSLRRLMERKGWGVQETVEAALIELEKALNAEEQLPSWITE